jgi:hypothetical protein
VRKKLSLTTVGNFDDLFGLSIRARIPTFYHDDFNANILHTEYGIPPLPSTLFKAPSSQLLSPQNLISKLPRLQDPKTPKHSMSASASYITKHRLPQSIMRLPKCHGVRLPKPS